MTPKPAELEKNKADADKAFGDRQHNFPDWNHPQRLVNTVTSAGGLLFTA
jgi:hypothetical protein